MRAPTGSRLNVASTIGKEIQKVTSLHRLFNRNMAVFVCGLLGLFSLWAAAPAAAAPSLGVTLERTPTVVPRSDEEVGYLVKVKNTAPINPSVGETLTCNPNNLVAGRWFNAAQFEYQWVANGVSLGSAHGAQTEHYEIQAADAGMALQCLLTATNASANSKAASFTPPLVVAPVPSTAPPAPASPGANLRPTVSGTAEANGELTCESPAASSWSGSPAWTFEWLRNGIPATEGVVTETTATTSKFKIGALEAPPTGSAAVFQCKAIGTNAGGAVVAVSVNKKTVPAPNPAPPNNDSPKSANNLPFIESLGATAGQVTLEIELPGGEETRVFRVVKPGGEEKVPPEGWSCTHVAASGGQHAKAICTTSESKRPQEEFPPVKVKTVIGADVEEPAIAKATVSGGGATSSAGAQDELDFAPAVPFGITPGGFTTKVTDPEGNDFTQAGGHPFSANATFLLNTHIGPDGAVAATENVRDIKTDLPPGFIGNPGAVPQQCETIEEVVNDRFNAPTCSRVSIVGGATLLGPIFGLTPAEAAAKGTATLPIYAVKPERGVPAQFVFGIVTQELVYSVTPKLRAGEIYAISIEAPQVVKTPSVTGVSFTLCGYGAKVFAGVQDVVDFEGCKKPAEAGANPKPFLTNPTECSGTPPVTKLSVDSWEHVGEFDSAEAVSPEVTGCESVPFSPTIELQPTSHQADSPTGLDVGITMPTQGLESANGISQSDLKKAVVTLPKGMSVNPSAADGLGACSSAQISLGTNEPIACPESSKIGSAEIVTPLLEQPLQGNVYLAKQGDNPFHSLLALYLVVESAERGILVKIPGHVEPRADGQLVADFDENPQVPFSSLKLHFNAGNRAPLLNPPACGSYGIESQLSPWSAPAEPRDSTSTFQITEGPNGGACPNGGLDPKLEAGLQNPVAGTTSPFVLRLSREDGTQRFKALDVTMPPGLTAYLKGVPYCPDSALASVSEAEGTGQAQVERPACPAASQIGTVSVGAGGGSNPFYVNTARAYLAGPYKGAPLSIAIVTPAVAGPFDLGSVVVRSAVHVDPETARITVDSDPIPTILHGIPLDVRDIRVNVDRPHFTLAPTSCKAKSVGATVTGENGVTATPSNRFQVGDCAALGFAPKLKLQLKGATRRIGHPGLKAVVTYPKRGEYANIGRAQVNLPHGEFLDQGNLNKTCTRPVLLAGNCPPSSVYGKAKAWTPLLGKPLEGNVYLVGGYGYKLPALVAELNGQIKILLVGKVDSGKNKGIRNTFEVVPDAPVSRFVLEMKGGKKYGLLENSENLCKAPKAMRRAIVSLTGQNGKVDDYKPVVRNDCGKKRHNKGKKKVHHKG